MASPVHQTAAVEKKSSFGTAPDTTSVPAPITALISMLPSAPTKTMARASRRLSS